MRAVVILQRRRRLLPKNVWRSSEIVGGDVLVTLFVDPCERSRPVDHTGEYAATQGGGLKKIRPRASYDSRVGTWWGESLQGPQVPGDPGRSSEIRVIEGLEPNSAVKRVR
jgi:hypothetical protein